MLGWVEIKVCILLVSDESKHSRAVLETKPPQCLKINIKHNLSKIPLLGALDYKTVGGRGCHLLQLTVIFFRSTFTVELYLYDYGGDQLIEDKGYQISRGRTTRNSPNSLKKIKRS